MNPNAASQLTQPSRSLLLDALRGLALLGICLANYPEFALYTFQKPEVVAAMPTAEIDRIVRFLQLLLIDGKFYSIFSLLFGIGFSIMITNAQQRGNSAATFFYRRLSVLAAIGFLHLMLLWSGDILLLYALAGILLPLFRRFSDKSLLMLSALLIFCPVLFEAAREASGGLLDPVGWLPPIIRHHHTIHGINDTNFGTWLVDGQTYAHMLHFMPGGAFIRVQELLGSHRFFKVLGLFTLGLYIGRHRLYAGLTEHKPLIIKIAIWGSIIGVPASCLYAWNAMKAQPLGITGSAMIYTASVVPMALAYMAGFALLDIGGRITPVFRMLAAPGRMALTNYIGQSAIGMLVFYGVGFGLGASLGLVHVEWVALGVFVLQIVFSMAWIHLFRFGPLEWIWRMLTYGVWLNPVRTSHSVEHSPPA